MAKCIHEPLHFQRESKDGRKVIRAGCSDCDIWGRWYNYHGLKPYDICKVISTCVHDFLWGEVVRVEEDDKTDELEKHILGESNVKTAV